MALPNLPCSVKAIPRFLYQDMIGGIGRAAAVSLQFGPLSSTHAKERTGVRGKNMNKASLKPHSLTSAAGGGRFTGKRIVALGCGVAFKFILDSFDYRSCGEQLQ